VQAEQFSLNMAKLSMSHAPDPVGFQVDLGFGKAFTMIHAGESAPNIFQYLEQAYVSFKPAKAKGLEAGLRRIRDDGRRRSDRVEHELELFARAAVRVGDSVLSFRPAQLVPGGQALHGRRAGGERVEQHRGQQQRQDPRFHGHGDLCEMELGQHVLRWAGARQYQQGLPQSLRQRAEPDASGQGERLSELRLRQGQLRGRRLGEMVGRCRGIAHPGHQQGFLYAAR
jgi:hypothetical protein